MGAGTWLPLCLHHGERDQSSWRTRPVTLTSSLAARMHLLAGSLSLIPHFGGEEQPDRLGVLPLGHPPDESAPSRLITRDRNMVVPPLTCRTRPPHRAGPALIRARASAHSRRS